MNKLTGHGRPTPHTVGEVGQYYEDIATGDLYECRIAQEFSPTHGWPVGGFVWELRATGEDVREIYGSGGAQPDMTINAISDAWSTTLVDKDGVSISQGSINAVKDAIRSGREPVVTIRYDLHLVEEDYTSGFITNIPATVMWYCEEIYVMWNGYDKLYNNLLSHTITFDIDGVIKDVSHKRFDSI